MNITKEDLGLKIKDLRLKKGVSQEELGEALSRSHAAISDIERGKTDMSVQDLSAVSDFFRVPLSYFVGDQSSNQFVSFNQHRFSKDISPVEKKQAEKASAEFDKFVKDILDKEARENV